MGSVKGLGARTLNSGGRYQTYDLLLQSPELPVKATSLPTNGQSDAVITVSVICDNSECYQLDDKVFVFVCIEVYVTVNNFSVMPG